MDKEERNLKYTSRSGLFMCWGQPCNGKSKTLDKIGSSAVVFAIEVKFNGRSSETIS